MKREFSVWYREGLHFSCTRCGNCCTGSSGTVRVSDVEIDALAADLGLPAVEFRRRFTRRLRGAELSLIERSNGDCVFWSPEEGCTVYRNRPRQCRTWPFWRTVVHSAERWEEEARSCPGMNRGARHHPETIASLAADDGTRPRGDGSRTDPDDRVGPRGRSKALSRGSSGTPSEVRSRARN